jgi:hypothetical protein
MSSTGPGVTWYEILGVLPGASAEKIRREYDAKRSLLRPELISGAPSNVLAAVRRAEGILDAAWRVLGDPVRRERYDQAAGLRPGGGSLARPQSVPADPGFRWSDFGLAGPAEDLLGAALVGLLAPSPGPPWRVAVPDVRGLFYQVCTRLVGPLNLQVIAVRLTEHPMPVDGLVVDQSPRSPAKVRRASGLTVQVWHPPARSR